MPERRREGARPPRVVAAAAVTPGTLRRYQAVFIMFQEWADAEGVVLSRGMPAWQLDALGARFLGDLSEKYEGGMRHVAACLSQAIYGALGERYRSRLPEIARVNKAWKRLYPGASHSPLPSTWVDFLAVELSRQGDLDMAIGALLLFNGFLRISELTGLRARDVLLPEDDRGSGTGAAGVRLAFTKTGRDQFAPVDDAVVLRYLRLLRLSVASGNQRLFCFAPATFNKALAKACRSLGFPVFTSHSFRHGAAARACLAGVPPEDIRRRGRWGSLMAMEPYLQTVRSMLLLSSTPAWLLPLVHYLPLWRANLGAFSVSRAALF